MAEESVTNNTITNTDSGGNIFNGVELDYYTASGQYTGSSFNVSNSVLKEVSTVTLNGYSSSNIYMYIPEGCDKNNAKIVYMAPGAGGGINYQTQGELFTYMCKENDPNTIYIYGNYCNRAEGPQQNFNTAMNYLQSNGYIGENVSLTYDSYSEGTTTAINSAIDAARMTNSSGGALCSGITVIIGGTGSGYITSKPTVEDLKLLSNADANVIFYQHTGSGGNNGSLSKSDLLITSTIVKRLVEADVNTFMFDINWEQFDADYGTTGYSAYKSDGQHLQVHPQLSSIFHKYIFPTLQEGSDTGISLTDGKYMSIKIPKDLDGDGNLELYDATEEDIAKLYPSLLEQYYSEERKNLSEAEKLLKEQNLSYDGEVSINKIDSSTFYSDLSKLGKLERNSSINSSNYTYTMDSMDSIRSQISASANECSQMSVVASRFSSGILAQIGAYVNKFYSSYGNLLSSLSSETKSVSSLAEAITQMDNDLKNKQGSIGEIKETDNSVVTTNDEKYQTKEENNTTSATETAVTATPAATATPSATAATAATATTGAAATQVNNNNSSANSYSGSYSNTNYSGNNSSSETTDVSSQANNITENTETSTKEDTESTSTIKYEKNIVDDNTISYSMEDGAKITIEHNDDTITSMSCEYNFDTKEIAEQNYQQVSALYSNSSDVESVTLEDTTLKIIYSDSFISNYKLSTIETIFNNK